MVVHIVIDNKGETVFHFLTVKGIMYEWNRVVLPLSTLPSKIYRRIHTKCY